MPKMRLGWYAGASTTLAGAVVFSAFQQRANFYSAMVYLSQSNFCLLVLINFTLLIYGTFIYALSKLCWGTLRTAEVEQLTERAWFAITETCLAMTIFRDQLGAWFLVMFTALVTGKVWGWIGDGRVEFLEQQPPANPRLFHTRLTISLLMSFIYDILILRYCINTVIQEAKPDMMVMFLFEFAVLSTTSWRCGARYILSIIEQKMIQTQTQARLLERRQEVREQRDAMIRQRQEATEAGRPVESEEPLPDPNDVDEMDIEVPGWATKGEWVLWLDLLTDTVKLVIYVTFFVLLTIFYNFPIHIMRDLLITARDFLKRLNSVLRYRRAIQEMNRYPDATQDELDQENTCIICREDMRVWDLNANPSALDRIRPKKLPCGHILHLGCLKSWLERQQVCPTCRSPVTADRASQSRNQNANRAPAAPQQPIDAVQPAAQLGLVHEPRLARFGAEHPVLDHAAQAALNVDAFGRTLNPVHQPRGRPNATNIRRPMEEFDEMMLEEERLQDAEERLRRRWRSLLSSDAASQQGQSEQVQPQSQMRPSQQSPSRSDPSQIQPDPPNQQPLTSAQSGQSAHSGAPGSTTGQQLSQSLQQNIHQTESASHRAFPPGPSYIFRQHQLQQQFFMRSQRLRMLTNMYSQASVLVRQEAELLRVSTEQLHVLGQLVGELERLELLANDNLEGTPPITFAEAQNTEHAAGQHSSLPAYTTRRVVPSRSDSPSMMRHVAASYSTAISSGSPDLPEGVAIPPGWTLMPLQRFENPFQAPQTGTQRSSRAPSAGPGTSTPGEDRSFQATTPQAPTSQPSIRSSAQVLERIPGTMDFRLSGSSGTTARSDAPGTTDTSVGEASSGRGTQQPSLERVLGRGESPQIGESASRARSEASASNATTAVNASGASDEEQQSPAVVSSNPVVPNWSGASQHFSTSTSSSSSSGGAARSEGSENAAVTAERGIAASAPTPTGGGENDVEGSSSSAWSMKATTDAEDAEHGKCAGKAVTVEEVSDEEGEE